MGNQPGIESLGDLYETGLMEANPTRPPIRPFNPENKNDDFAGYSNNIDDQKNNMQQYSTA